MNTIVNDQTDSGSKKSTIIAKFVRFILEGDILPRFNLARGVPGAVSTISSYIIIGFGIIVAVRGSGIDLNSFALLAGALGVGIGFGLQDIVKNFISTHSPALY